jgi:hypothetical protein
MIKSILIYILLLMPVLSKSQTLMPEPLTPNSCEEPKDSLVWKLAIEFENGLNSADTAAMKKLLPNDFLLQWMHEDFIGRKSLLKAMMDTSVLATLRYHADIDEKAVIRYSDDNTSVSLNTSFEFLDKAMAESIKKEHGYGLCIFYFQKVNGIWRIRTVHLDLHCSTCNL